MWGILGGLIGLVGGAFGSGVQAEQVKATYLYNASVSSFNATLADLKATDAVERGRADEQRIAGGARQLKGKQIATAASSGLAIGSGTPLAVIAGTDVSEAQDIDTLRGNVNREVFAAELEAMRYRSQAATELLQAELTDPIMAGITSTAGSAGQVAGAIGSYNR